MSLIRFFYEPFDSITEFEEAYTAGMSSPNRRHHHHSRSLRLKPKMDIHESPDTKTVTATFELPGLRKEDVHIELHDDRITLSGETSLPCQKDYAVHERRHGKFSRTLCVPHGAKPEDIAASMEHGILTLTFPNTANPISSPPRQIPIH